MYNYLFFYYFRLQTSQLNNLYGHIIWSMLLYPSENMYMYLLPHVKILSFPHTLDGILYLELFRERASWIRETLFIKIRHSTA